MLLAPFRWGYSFVDPELVVVYEEPVVWKLGMAPPVIDHKDYYFKQGLKIEEGVRILFKNSSRLIIFGDFEVLGKTDRPVIFEGIEENNYNFSISVQGAEKTYINNAVFRRGGFSNCSASNFEKSFFQKVFADSECRSIGVLNLNSSDELTINDSIFEENHRAINIIQVKNALLTNNFFYHNKELAVYSEAEAIVRLKSNCWMRPSGPTYVGNPNGRGEQIEGNFNIEFFRECGSEFKPIILIPGIGGSFNWEIMFENRAFLDIWSFMPTVHNYDAWEESLKDLGYKKNRDYFIVYYDWRGDNNENLEKYLLPKLEEIKELSYDEKFDIIAHSMGGFMTIDYLTDDDYRDDIDKVVLQGTPLMGSSKVYQTWEGGIIPEDWGEITNWYLSRLSEKDEADSLDNYDIVHKYIPSTKQLLPIYNYLEKGVDSVNFWEMEEKNDYLSELMPQLFEDKNDFDFENNLLMIQGTGHETSEKIKVEDYDGEASDKLWRDGKIISEDFTNEGDGTVLNLSSGTIPLFGTITLEDTKHEELPAKAVAETGEFLGIPFEDKDYSYKTIKEKLMLLFACPIDVVVEDSNGNLISKDDSQIDGAYYYSDGKADGYKIIEIQNPQGEYILKITGNGEGVFDAFVYKTSEVGKISTEFNGEISINDEIEYDIVFDDNEININEIVAIDDDGEENNEDEDEDENDDEDDENDKKKEKKEKKNKDKNQEKELGYIKNYDKKQALN